VPFRNRFDSPETRHLRRIQERRGPEITRFSCLVRSLHGFAGMVVRLVILAARLTVWFWLLSALWRVDDSV
jgi:hypothetical protein